MCGNGGLWNKSFQSSQFPSTSKCYFDTGLIQGSMYISPGLWTNKVPLLEIQKCSSVCQDKSKSGENSWEEKGNSLVLIPGKWRVAAGAHGSKQHFRSEYSLQTGLGRAALSTSGPSEEQPEEPSIRKIDARELLFQPWSANTGAGLKRRDEAKGDQRTSVGEVPLQELGEARAGSGKSLSLRSRWRIGDREEPVESALLEGGTANWSQRGWYLIFFFLPFLFFDFVITNLDLNWGHFFSFWYMIEFASLPQVGPAAGLGNGLFKACGTEVWTDLSGEEVNPRSYLILGFVCFCPTT